MTESAAAPAGAEAARGTSVPASAWARLLAAVRWVLQRDVGGSSPWDERWASCGPLPGDERQSPQALLASVQPPRR